MGQKIAILLLTASDVADKGEPLLVVTDGQDLLSQTTKCAVSTGVPVYITIATKRMALAKAISREPVTIIPLPKKCSGMPGAIREGIRSLPVGLGGVLIMLAGMARLTANDLEVLLTHFAELGATRTICATDDTGHPGFPIVLPSRYFRRAAKMKASESVFRLTHHQDLSLVRLTNGHAKTDVTLPVGWVAWRAGRWR